MVECLREIFLSVRTMSQSAAVPMTFLPTRRRKSSPLCWPLSATSQPHTSRLLSVEPRPFSCPPPPTSSMLTIAVPWPIAGGIGIPPPPPPIIACCISRQYGHWSQLGCMTCPLGHTFPPCLSRPLKRPITSRNTMMNTSNSRLGRLVEPELEHVDVALGAHRLGAH